MIRSAGNFLVLDEFFVFRPYKDGRYECFFQCAMPPLHFLESYVYQVEPIDNVEAINVRVLCSPNGVVPLSQKVLRNYHPFISWRYPGIIPFPKKES